ncbi:hypothetical protein M422DRAFT_236342 [Sphaerobolus stellatus SS14]|uniref:HMA domain-containing protein n=1 Tax=Sphaerobolus stellatus (strain SS14) TaxID=990650 RepID=A0A0C9TYM4_SPHS4|nr:hypothetical protein M422DRAFT_236342 [Sphaerobolus stellatus SS14]
MTCSSCTSAVIRAMEGVPSVEYPSVDLLGNSGSIVVPSKEDGERVKNEIEDAGFDCIIVDVQEQQQVTKRPATYKFVFSIEGMTCSSCTSAVIRAMEGVPSVTFHSVDLLGNSGSVVVLSKEDGERVKNEIEDAGFDCIVVDVQEQQVSMKSERSKSETRSVTLRIDGIIDQDSVEKVEAVLTAFSKSHVLSYTPLRVDNPTTVVTYIPDVPSFTIRTILDDISSLKFRPVPQSAVSVEDRAAVARLREERRILALLITAGVFAIPTFIIAVLGSSLLPKTHPFRLRLETPVWGNASLGTVVLFALVTPVQLGVGSFFYARAWKNVKAVWRPRRASENVFRLWIQRLFRWGSMDSLVGLGTGVGYVASLALMILDIRTKPVKGKMGGELGWFDSSVFLMFFILCGRFLESLTRHRTSSAISALSATLPSTGLLISSVKSPPEEVSTLLLEIGDTVLVPVGSSPPLDGILADNAHETCFSESSLTGEAVPVPKRPGDLLFVGTINEGPNAALMKVTSLPGHTMLDGIVGVVRDAMGRKAGIEKIADVLTGWFVPFVVGVAGLTFAIWSLRGYLHNLPSQWEDSGRGGGWSLFALQFGVAVLVVACPCGIGLAGPTAQMVGLGLAARHGVLSNGGGEAFHALSNGVDAVVMDKTGTITQGNICVGEKDVRVFSTAEREREVLRIVCAMLRAAEGASTHPVAVGVKQWCENQLQEINLDIIPSVELVSTREIPGRGLLATLLIKPSQAIELAVGNEKLLQDINAEYPAAGDSTEANNLLEGWKISGKSVVLVSGRIIAIEGEDNLVSTSEIYALSLLKHGNHTILAHLGVHDPPRAEAAILVSELRQLGIDTWMLTGDNEITARSIANRVGIESNRVIAGALPGDKQTWVKRVQDGELEDSNLPKKRKLVAFVGDGINDAPALAQADVSFAMGSGSSIALSTASFTLLSRTSPLLSILTIHHIAYITRRKIWTNFVWACVYNVCLMPLAAGAFYAINGKRITLPPVWASAAMALSSVSVVSNSLLLKWRYKEPAVVRKWRSSDKVGVEV